MLESMAILAALMRKIRVGTPADMRADPFLAVTLRPCHGMALKVEAA